MTFLQKIIRKLKQTFFKEKYYVSICCIQKDENQYLTEWIDYHLKIDVDHFFIYDNGSQKSPKEQLKKYIDKKIVTLIDFPGKEKQFAAYNDCLKDFGYLSRWIAYIDVDEFIVPKNINNSVKNLLKDYENYGGLGVNWLVFGSNGHKNKTNKSQLESFIMRSEFMLGINDHIKSIVQPRYTRNIINPHCFQYKDAFHCVNENYLKIKDAFSPHSSEKIQLNHYYCRSEEEYLEKISRGYADKLTNRTFHDFLNHDRDCNKIEDYNALKIFNKM